MSDLRLVCELHMDGKPVLSKGFMLKKNNEGEIIDEHFEKYAAMLGLSIKHTMILTGAGLFDTTSPENKRSFHKSYPQEQGLEGLLHRLANQSLASLLDTGIEQS